MVIFGYQIESMGPYYALVDLNGKEIAKEHTKTLEEEIAKAGGTIACEIKEDGFRFQPHVDKKKMDFFTRGRDSTKTTKFETKCLPEIVDALASLNLQKTILDCEIIGTGGRFAGFEAIHKRARYAGRIKDKGIQQYLNQDKLPEKYPLELVIFDILMKDGKDCTSLPYTQRRKIIEELICAASARIKISEQKLIMTPQEIIAQYKQKVQKEKFEGLILKQPNLQYLPGDKTHWIKLKKFETLDLVVVGLCKPDSGADLIKDNFGQALVASYNSEMQKYQAIGVISLVRTNAATNNSFANDVYEQISKILIKTPPQNVEFGKRTPDAYIAPENSIVIEIGAMNIIKGTNTNSACSTDGKNFYSLRIAYVKNMREDKTSIQATTSKQIADLHSIQK